MYYVYFYSHFADKKVLVSRHRTLKAAYAKKNAYEKDIKYVKTLHITTEKSGEGWIK